jgi:hypothetical protein
MYIGIGFVVFITNCTCGFYPFDSRWVPPVGGAPSRHTGTGGATAGVHAQCLRDPGAGGQESSGAPSGSQAKSSGAPRGS